jgi:cysteine desulfurase
MLSRLSKHAARHVTAAQTTYSAVFASGSRRGLVQPSGADRAKVMDLPATYRDESHFTPRSGGFPAFYLRYTLLISLYRHAWIQT